MNRYALLKDSINDSIFGVIVDSNGLSKFYGVSAKGLEWSKWANGINVKSENNGLPIGVVVGGYSALRNTSPNYVQALVDTVSLRNPSINKKQGISDSLIKNSSSVVPGVRDAELRAFDIDKRNEAIAFKARAFRTDSKVSSLLTQVRAERLGFVSAEGVFSSRNPIHTPEVKQAEIIDSYGRSLQRAIGLSLIRKKSVKMLAVVRKDQALAKSFGIEVKAASIGPKIGSRLSGGLRAAPAGMSFVDITGVTDADTDGIVFEGKPGLERPIIPRFMVPKDLARKLSGIVEGDAEVIEKQRRAGNTSVQFDEGKLRNIIASVGGDANMLTALTGENGIPVTTPSGRERLSVSAPSPTGIARDVARDAVIGSRVRSGQRSDLGDATPLSSGELKKLSQQELVDRLIEDRNAGLNLEEAAKKYGLKGGRAEARRLEAREMSRRNSGMRSRVNTIEEIGTTEPYRGQLAERAAEITGKEPVLNGRLLRISRLVSYEPGKQGHEDMANEIANHVAETRDAIYDAVLSGDIDTEEANDYIYEMFDNLESSLKEVFGVEDRGGVWSDMTTPAQQKFEEDFASDAAKRFERAAANAESMRNLKEQGIYSDAAHGPSMFEPRQGEDLIDESDKYLDQELSDLRNWSEDNPLADAGEAWDRWADEVRKETGYLEDASLNEHVDTFLREEETDFLNAAYRNQQQHLGSRADAVMRGVGMRSRNFKMSGAPKEIQDSYSEDDIKKIENSLRTGGLQDLRLRWDSENNGWMLDSFDADGEVFIEADAPLVSLTDGISDAIADRYDSVAYDGEPPYLSNMNELLPDEEDREDSWIKEYPVSGMRSRSGGMRSRHSDDSADGYAEADAPDFNREDYENYIDTPTFEEHLSEWLVDNPGKTREDFINDPDGAELAWDKFFENDDPKKYYGISDAEWAAAFRSRSGNINSFDDYLDHPAFDRDFAEWSQDNPGKTKRDFINDPDGAEEYFSLGMEEAGASLNPESYFGTSGMRSRRYRNDDDSDYGDDDYGVDRGDWDDDLDPDERRRIMDGMRSRSGGMRSRVDDLSFAYPDEDDEGIYTNGDIVDEFLPEDYETSPDKETWDTLKEIANILDGSPSEMSSSTVSKHIDDIKSGKVLSDERDRDRATILEFFENGRTAIERGVTRRDVYSDLQERVNELDAQSDRVVARIDKDKEQNDGKKFYDLDRQLGRVLDQTDEIKDRMRKEFPDLYNKPRDPGMRSRSGMRSRTEPLFEAERLSGYELSDAQQSQLYKAALDSRRFDPSILDDGGVDDDWIMDALNYNFYNAQVNDDLAADIEDLMVERDNKRMDAQGRSTGIAKDNARSVIKHWQDSVDDDPDKMGDLLSSYEGDLVAAMEDHYDDYLNGQLDTFENRRDGGMPSRSGGMRSRFGMNSPRDKNVFFHHVSPGGKNMQKWSGTAEMRDVVFPKRDYTGAEDVSYSDKIILSAPSDGGAPEGKVYIAEFDEKTGRITVRWGKADSRNLQTKIYSGKTEEDFHKLLEGKEKRGYRLEGGRIPAKDSSDGNDQNWTADYEKQAKMGMRSSTGTERRPYTNVPVTGSSALRQASYNAEKEELVVTYANGKTYTYKNFSNDDLDNALSGPDYVLTGTVVNQIKKNHDFREGGVHTFDPQYQDVQGPGGEFSVGKLSRLGRGEKTQIPVSGSSAIEALTWDDENEDLIVTYAGGRTYTYKDVDSYWIEDLERETGTGRIINNIKKEGYRVVDGGEHGDMPSEGLTAERAEFGMRSRMAPSSGRIRAAEMEISARPQGMASRRSEGLRDARFAVPGRDRVDPSDGELWGRLSDEEKATVADRAVNREKMLLNEFKQRFPRWWDRASKEADKKGWDKDLMNGGNAGWMDELHRFVTRLADDPDYPEKNRVEAEKQFNDLQALYNMRSNRGSHDLLEHLNPTSRRYLFDDARRDDSKKTRISASGKEMKTPSTAPRPLGDPIDTGTPIREQVGQNEKKPLKARLDAYYKRMSDKILYTDPARQARREMRKARRQGINAGGFTTSEANPVDDAKRKIRRRKRLKEMRKNRTRDIGSISDSSTGNRIDGRLAHTDSQGSLVFGDKLTSTLATMMTNYRTESKLKKTKGGVSRNRALAVLWDGAGYNGTPHVITAEEFKTLHAAGWVPVVRGHGGGANGVRYANDWLDDPVRFITGQGGEAQGEGEYWARPTQGGGGWFSWMDGSLPAGTVGLLPPSTRRVSKAELGKIKSEHAPLAKSIKAFDAGLPSGEREKMDAEEYVTQLRDHLRSSLGPIYESTMSTKMGQMTSKILESLSGSSDSKKQELLDALEFLELISTKRTSNSYAPLLGYDTIMADSGVELIHNRTAITIVGDTFTRDDAVKLAKSKA